VVQTNVGHRDTVHDILHVPERGQVCDSFVSGLDFVAVEMENEK